MVTIVARSGLQFLHQASRLTDWEVHRESRLSELGGSPRIEALRAGRLTELGGSPRVRLASMDKRGGHVKKMRGEISNLSHHKYHSYDANRKLSAKLKKKKTPRPIWQFDEVVDERDLKTTLRQGLNRTTTDFRQVSTNEVNYLRSLKTAPLGLNPQGDMTVFKKTKETPNWVELRESYMKQLEDLVSKVILAPSANARQRPMYLLLLGNLRKVTAKILETYLELKAEAEAEKMKQTDGGIGMCNDFDNSVEIYLQLKKYILGLATSVDWLNEKPFVNWSCVNPCLNPFFLTHNIVGSLSVNMDTRTLEKELQCPFDDDITTNAEKRAYRKEVTNIIREKKQGSQAVPFKASTYSVVLVKLLPSELLLDEVQFKRYENFGKRVLSSVVSSLSCLLCLPHIFCGIFSLSLSCLLCLPHIFCNLIIFSFATSSSKPF